MNEAGGEGDSMKGSYVAVFTACQASNSSPTLLLHFLLDTRKKVLQSPQRDSLKPPLLLNQCVSGFKLWPSQPSALAG